MVESVLEGDCKSDQAHQQKCQCTVLPGLHSKWSTIQTMHKGEGIFIFLHYFQACEKLQLTFPGHLC